MSIVPRGWSTCASRAAKLAAAEKIIGYKFKRTDLLYEALDQTKPLSVFSGGELVRPRTRNTRLALVGDALARLDLVRQWYDNPDLPTWTWQHVQTALSNEHLGRIGYKLGLDECAIPRKAVSRYNIASTVEAVFAAVYMDGASESQLHKVMVRFGVRHKIIDPTHRAWIHAAVLSKLDLPDRFFIGHHFKLQQSIFETSLKGSQPSPASQKIGLWEHLRRLLWMEPSKQTPREDEETPREDEETPREGTRLRNPRRPKFRKSAALSSGKVRRVEGEAKAQTNKRAATFSDGIDSGETGTLATSPPGNSGEDERASGSREMTEKQDVVETNQVSKGSASNASPPEATKSQATKSQATKSQATKSQATNSQATKSQATKSEAPTPTKITSQSTRSNPRATGTQGSDKASEEEPGPGLSKKEGTTASVQPKGERQPQENSAAEVDAVKQVLSSEVAAVENKLEILESRRRVMQDRFRELRAAGKPENAHDLRVYKTSTERQARVASHLVLLKKKLNTLG